MPGFDPAEQTILCDGLSLVSIAKAEGTPLYVYSAAAIRARYREINDAFGSYPHAVHYALKANSTLGIVRLLRSLGSAVDANSGGEIEVALHAGFNPDQIVFTGVGKTGDELERAVALGVKAINVESPGELERLEAIARSQGCARSRRPARQSRHRRRKPPAHLNRTQHPQVWDVDRSRASDLPLDVLPPSAGPRGHPRSRGIADRDPRAAPACCGDARETRV